MSEKRKANSDKEAEIKSRVLKQDWVDWKALEWIQGSLKELTEINFEKLVTSIVDNDIVKAFHVWEHEGKLYCLDGNHLKKALEEIEKRKLRRVPAQFKADFIECKNMKEAKKLVLVYSAVYAQVTEERLYDYLHTNDLLDEWQELKFELSLPDINLDEINLGELAEYDSNNKWLTDEDAIPEKPKIAINKLGDLWRLGNHRLLCGDSTKIDDITTLMNKKKGLLGFTSPPYWVGKEYENQKSIGEINELIKKSCIGYNFAIQKDFSRIIINTSTGFTTSFDKKKKRQVLLLIDKWTNYFYEIGWNLRHIRHWIKEGQLKSTSPKTDLIDQHCEFIGTFEQDDGEEIKFNDTLPEEDIEILETFYNTSGTSRGQNRTGQKWALRSYWNDIRGNANQTGHCASFPVELVRRHLFLYTNKNDIVVDLFLGSGTTIIACEMTDRIGYGMDIEPLYCDIAIQRWQDFTGKEAVREDGVKFNDLKANSEQPKATGEQ